MDSFIKALDDLPLWLKIVLALPMLDIVWGVYRIIKSVIKSNALGIVIGVLFIIFASFPIAIFDIIYLILYKRSVWWLD